MIRSGRIRLNFIDTRKKRKDKEGIPNTSKSDRWKRSLELVCAEMVSISAGRKTTTLNANSEDENKSKATPNYATMMFEDIKRCFCMMFMGSR